MSRGYSRRVLRAAVFGVSGALLLACTPQGSPKQPYVPIPGPSDYTQQEYQLETQHRRHAAPMLNACGLGVFNVLLGTSADQNLALSPTSLGRTLLMAYLGAGGTTKDELAAVLGMADQGEQSILDWFAASGPDWDQHGVSIGVADSAWVRRDFKVSPVYLAALQQRLSAEVTGFDDASDATRKIGEWISRTSNGALDGQGISVKPGEVLGLLDVTRFDGRWATVFGKASTATRPFYPEASQSVQVPMMSQSGKFGYAEGSGFQVVRLPYEQSVYAMYLVLPAATATSSADLPPFEQLIGNCTDRLGDLSFPRFAFGETRDLQEPLKAIGLRGAFSPGADFGGIAPQLYLDQALQQCRVTVDEEGTVAAAATLVTAGRGGISGGGPTPFVFEANRPFFFALRDDLTGALLFVGRVVHP